MRGSVCIGNVKLDSWGADLLDSRCELVYEQINPEVGSVGSQTLLFSQPRKSPI